MKLKEIYSKSNTQNSPVVSYEVYPPKEDNDGKKLMQLFDELNILKKFNPSVISVTYGAGGSNQTESIEIIKKIKNDLQVTPMPHFTCVSTKEDDIKDYLTSIENLQVKNILALRGDIPKEGNVCNDFKHADELVHCIKQESDLSVAVAGYPEGHREAESLESDIFYLKKKVDEGADVIFTQLFFDNNHFFNFVEKCQKSGINIPIAAGILPVTSYKQLEKMTTMCKVDIPDKFRKILERYKDDKDYIKQAGIEYSTNQCIQLAENQVAGLHFYTLNKSYATSQILNNL